MQKLFETALEEAQKLHKTHPVVRDFIEFPDDCRWRNLEALPIPAASLMANDLSLESMETSRMRDAFIKPWQVANWRETYKDTNIGEDFLSRFACYELFGHAGHFQTQKARGFLVYSDANLYYPWHHHPAEELYFIIAGEASFATEGNAPKLLKPGDTVFHASNQPHNMQTHDKGVLAYVVWRNEFDIAPVLTDRLNG
jgi:quercetin dioxygenase-like cupin family protein